MEMNYFELWLQLYSISTENPTDSPLVKNVKIWQHKSGSYIVRKNQLQNTLMNHIVLNERNCYF